MSTLGIGAFDRTLLKTEAWIREINHEMRWSDSKKSYKALRVVLHALRDRLPADEAVQLGAQLPMLVRGFYYDGWKPSRTPDKTLDFSSFLAKVDEAFRDEIDFDAERACRAVFLILERHVSPGESHDIGATLPAGLRELWDRARAA